MTANAGYHAYATGDVLTAAQVQYNLQNQTTMYFATSSARTTALASVLVEGMVSYIPANGIEYYNGSAWVSISQAVTALTTKGDLLTYSTQDTRLPVGSDGQTLVANSAQTTGLGWQSAYNGNACINGGMDFWQRGVGPTTTLGYATADRWWTNNSAGTTTISQESTTIPAGYRYSQKITQSVATATTVSYQAMETGTSVMFAGQTISLSCLVASSASQNITLEMSYSTTVDNAMSGTWTAITSTSGGTATPTSTTFIKLAGVYAIPSTAKSLRIGININSVTSGISVYWTGMQFEFGSVPTTFKRAGGTLQGELAACQRYYYRQTADGDVYQNFGFGMVTNTTTVARIQISNPVTMRAKPTSIDFATLRTADYGSGYAVSAITFGETGIYSNWLTVTMAAGTAYRPVALTANNSSSAYIGVSAEL